MRCGSHPVQQRLVKVYGDGMKKLHNNGVFKGWHLINRDEVYQVLREYTECTPHGAQDITYHMDNNNLDAVEHILKYFKIRFSMITSGQLILKLRGTVAVGCKSIW